VAAQVRDMREDADDGCAFSAGRRKAQVALCRTEQLSPGADVGGASAVPAQMWAGRAQAGYRCGHVALSVERAACKPILLAML
jgi:beta-lactamase class A